MIRRFLSPLAARLALAFLTVAAIAVALLSALTLLSAQSQVAGLVSGEQRSEAGNIAAVLGQAYAAAGSWRDTNLSGAYALAASASAGLSITDTTGAAVSVDSSAMERLMQQMQHGAAGMGGMMAPSASPRGGPTVSEPVVAGGATVGAVHVTFPATTPSAAQGLSDALGRTVLIGAVVAAVSALAVAIFVSRRLTRPLTALTVAASRLRSGDRSARVSGGAPGELGTLADTFNAMAATLEKEEEIRRALVADVAHELRTPVTILQGESEELLDGVAPATPERLSSLHDETLRLGRLVEDLEALNAAQAAGVRMERRHIDLAVVAEGAAAALRSRFTDADVDLRTELNGVVVDGDPTRLHQIVTNLLTNALKYTPSGGHAWLRVGTDGALARIEVQDDGPGIPATELPHIFERFWRGTSAATRAAGGRGIGLAVVAELVRAHGGRVDAHSVEGAGATFVVQLPQA